MNIDIKYVKKELTKIKGYIKRSDDNFSVIVFCTKDFINEFNQSRLNEVIKKYIIEHSIVNIDEKYYGTWDYARFKFTKDDFEQTLSRGIRTEKIINKVFLKLLDKPS